MIESQVERISWLTVEVWDEQIGSWMDLGEARSWSAGRARVAGLIAADGLTARRYRVVEHETKTVEMDAREDWRPPRAVPISAEIREG